MGRGRRSAAEERIGMSAHTNTTVLVVDDNPAMVYLLDAALTASGYQVITTVARDTVEIARERQPAVILLDMMMPEIDGAEVCRRLRADLATARIPIIALSARLNLHLHAAEMQAEDYLPKPFELSDLVEKVGTWARMDAVHGDSGQDADASGLRTPARPSLSARIDAVASRA